MTANIFYINATIPSTHLRVFIMADLYFGLTNPDQAASYYQYGGNDPADSVNVLLTDPLFTLIAPPQGIILTELAIGLDSANAPGGTVEVVLNDITAGGEGSSPVARATVNIRSDNQGYVWHTANVNVTLPGNKTYALGFANPSIKTWITAAPELSPAIRPSTDVFPNTWTANSNIRTVPMRAGYSLGIASSLAGIDLLNLKDISQAGHPNVASGLTATLRVYNASPFSISTQTATVGANGNVTFLNNAWNVGDVLDVDITVGGVTSPRFNITVVDKS